MTSFAEISFYSVTPGTSLVLITCKHHDTPSCPSALVQPNPRATGWMFLWNSWGWKAKGWMGKKTQIVAEQTHRYSIFSWYFPCQVTEMTISDCITKCRHYLGTFLQTQDVFSSLPMYHRMYNSDSAFRLLGIWSKLLFLHRTLVNINACTYTCLSARNLAISTVSTCYFSWIRTIPHPPNYKIPSELKSGCNSPAISCLLQSFTVIKL